MLMKPVFNISKGTIITCYHCKKQIAEFIKEVKEGDPLTYKDVKGIGDVEITPKSSMTCPDCGKHYVAMKKYGGIADIHTSEGWLVKGREENA